MNGPKAIDPVYGSVTQGATQSFEYDVESGKRTLELVLRWDNSQNSLRLYLIRPDGHRYDPYSDNYDGVINGVIPVRITSTSLINGMWRFDVSGYDVSGTQSFTLSMNAV